MRSIGRIIYSIQAQKRIRELIRRTKPDIAHLHMIDHQISPSILSVLKEEGIPVVQTVHTYKPVCPSYRLYHMNRGEICEKCIRGAYYQAVLNRCHKNSIFASMLVALEMYIHKSLKLYHRFVDLYIVPSQFMADKMVEGGYDVGKIRLLYHFLNIKSYPYKQKSKNYFLYFGRLAREKGLMTLVKAMENVNGSILKIAGDGPMRPMLENYVQEKSLKNVEFLGMLNGSMLKSVISNASFVVLPSEWYENSPMVIYEAFTLGKPVIGSRIGGIPEFIRHGENGYLFEPADDQELGNCINHLIQKKSVRTNMGKAVREKALRLFNEDFHYKQIMDLYHSII
jgi:glycosyltransferase involved in cell wall biosynthesis